MGFRGSGIWDLMAPLIRDLYNGFGKGTSKEFL